MARINKVQHESVNAAKIFHAKGLKKIIRNTGLAMMKTFNPQLMPKRTSWIYEYDATSVSDLKA